MIDLMDYGYQGGEADLADGLVAARITELHRELYKAVCPYGEVTAILKGSYLHHVEDRSSYPAVGDFVLLKYNAAGRSSIVKLLPRRSTFSRTDFSGHAVGYVKTILEQVVAANFDYVFIMSSLNQDFNLNRIARYLSQARQSGGTPVVILTKADLCVNCEAQVEAIRELDQDVEVFPISSYTGTGLDKVASYLQSGKTVVFLGMSGVGKSSLLNALAGKELMAVSEIREDDSRGRHTTTHRQLIRLPSGAMIIDTPGMRELGLWNADEGISTVFEDLEALIARCRFSDCSHHTEPGCAVQAALADGSLAQNRWESYLSQKQEAAFVHRKVRSEKRRR
ncbi:MAG: ribosome small subunit-dependent GTPase A [Bacillota bacterium]